MWKRQNFKTLLKLVSIVTLISYLEFRENEVQITVISNNFQILRTQQEKYARVGFPLNNNRKKTASARLWVKSV